MKKLRWEEVRDFHSSHIASKAGNLDFNLRSLAPMCLHITAELELKRCHTSVIALRLYTCLPWSPGAWLFSRLLWGNLSGWTWGIQESQMIIVSWEQGMMPFNIKMSSNTKMGSTPYLHNSVVIFQSSLTLWRNHLWFLPCLLPPYWGIKSCLFLSWNIFFPYL